MDEFLVNHNFTPFIDTKPGVPAAEKYKALGGIAFQPHQTAVRDKRGPGGLKAFVSPDGMHWKKLRDEPVVPEEWGKYFDSQNYAFWSESEQRYVCYFRRFIKGCRGIARTTSEDFIHWTPFVEMQANLPGEHLYTSCTQPYFRAPHIYVALPTRFMDKRGAATDILFMSTRGGSRYDREFTESYIRPGIGQGRLGRPRELCRHRHPPDRRRGNVALPHRRPSLHAAARRFYLGERTAGGRRVHHEAIHVFRPATRNQLLHERRRPDAH